MDDALTLKQNLRSRKDLYLTLTDTTGNSINIKYHDFCILETNSHYFRDLGKSSTYWFVKDNKNVATSKLLYPMLIEDIRFLLHQNNTTNFPNTLESSRRLESVNYLQCTKPHDTAFYVLETFNYATHIDHFSRRIVKFKETNLTKIVMFKLGIDLEYMIKNIQSQGTTNENQNLVKKLKQQIRSNFRFVSKVVNSGERYNKSMYCSCPKCISYRRTNNIVSDIELGTPLTLEEDHIWYITSRTKMYNVYVYRVHPHDRIHYSTDLTKYLFLKYQHFFI